MSEYAHGWRYGFTIAFVFSAVSGAFGDSFRGQMKIRLGDPQGVWHYHADGVNFSLACIGFFFSVFVGLLL